MKLTPDELSKLNERQEEWEKRLLSDALIKIYFFESEVKDPCVHCGGPTVLGSGNFVNRIPADRYLEDGTYIDGYMCATCQTPPLCEECGERESEYLNFRCDKCEEEIC